MAEVSASVLSINPENSMQELHRLEYSRTDYFHIDVMDGIFVDNLTNKMMYEYTSNIKQFSNTLLDVHLMVKDIEKYIEQYIPFDPNCITFHIESVGKNEAFEYIKLIKENNIKVGLAISPQTKIEDIYEFLPFLHMVLIMAVEPRIWRTKFQSRYNRKS